MIVDRRPYYLAGAIVGLGIIALFWFGPHTTPEERVAGDVAVVAKEPWDVVHVQRVQTVGSPDAPTGAYIHGWRPDGRAVVVHFVAGSPYSSPTAIRRLQETAVEGRAAEVLMVPRSLVHRKYVGRYDANATHAGIAFYAPPEPMAVDSLDAGIEAVRAAHAPEG
jgi:hypothetical protein